MGIKRMVLSVMVLTGSLVVAASAQASLSDRVTESGFKWMIGTWAATTEQGDEVVFGYQWILDRHAIATHLQMRDFALAGMIVLVPSSEEIIQFGADNRGGIWKGAWHAEDDRAVYRLEHIAADGNIQKADIVYRKVDTDAIKVAMYGVDDNGYRRTEPWSTLTYHRHNALTNDRAIRQSVAGSPSGSLGALLAGAGYDWLIGRWQSSDERGRLSHVEYALTLDGYAGRTDVKIGSFVYQGMVVFVPSREEVIQIGADNFGGLWKGRWTAEGNHPVNRQEYTRSDGEVRTIDHVYVKSDDGAFQVQEYSVQSGNDRAATPLRTLTFRAQ